MVRSFFMGHSVQSWWKPLRIDGRHGVGGADQDRRSPVRAAASSRPAVFVFVGAWNEFLFALILTSGKTTTATVALLSFRTSQGIEWDTISAGAFMVSLPVIIFAFVMQRYLVEGLTMGAVK